MEFVKFPKIPRLKRGMFVTEKIDGTNAQVYIERRDVIDEWVKCAELADLVDRRLVDSNDDFYMFVGSRNRYLAQGQDNYGFYKWACENSEELLKLGHGRHYGEWWGQGIQRGYDRKDKRFSLFNVGRWLHPDVKRPACVRVVPLLFEGQMNIGAVEYCLRNLTRCGSQAAPGFPKPEGVVVFHTAMNGYFKVMCEHDEIPKGKLNE